MPRLPPNGSIPRLWRHHSRRPRKRSCDSMLCRSSCARSSPARPLLGLLVWSLSIRRSAASARSRARCRSATVYCRSCGRVRFPRGPFDALFAGMADLGCFTVFLSGIASMQYNRLSLSLNARKALGTIVQCAGRPSQQWPTIHPSGNDGKRHTWTGKPPDHT